MKTRLLVCLFATALLFNCSKDDDNNSDEGFNGSLEDIRAFLNDDLVDALLDLDFNINTGSNPPNIEGSYFVSPLILEASSVSSDVIGYKFNDYTITVSNQDNENLTIDYLGDQGVQTDEGDGSFISGDDNGFSIFLITTSTNAYDEMGDSAIAISGKFTEDGIENLQLAYMMLDNRGNPSGTWIPNNSGRVTFDSDKFSPKQ